VSHTRIKDIIGEQRKERKKQRKKGKKKENA